MLRKQVTVQGSGVQGSRVLGSGFRGSGSGFKSDPSSSDRAGLCRGKDAEVGKIGA